MLEELAAELPQEFYKELNGHTLPQAKLNPAAVTTACIYGRIPLRQEHGRYIVIYYGSFNVCTVTWGKTL